jgi:GxxExxY protein
MVFVTHFWKKMNENKIASVVIGVAIEVHRQLGPGLLENVYKECLAHALIEAGLSVEKEVPVPVIFHDIKLPCGYRIDLLVEGILLIEIKSVERLNDIHIAQVLTYLKLGDYRLGLLMNFNVLKLKDGFRRLINGQVKET